MIDQPEQQLIETQQGFATMGVMGAPDAIEGMATEASREQLAKGVGERGRVGSTWAAPFGFGLLGVCAPLERKLGASGSARFKRSNMGLTNRLPMNQKPPSHCKS
jgi:hypothetical protein